MPKSRFLSPVIDRISAVVVFMRADDLLGECSKSFVAIEGALRTSTILFIYFGIIIAFQWDIENNQFNHLYKYFGIINNPIEFFDKYHDEIAPGTLSGIVAASLITLVHFIVAFLLLILGPILVFAFYAIGTIGIILIPIFLIGIAFLWILDASKNITEKISGVRMGELTSLYFLIVTLSIMVLIVYGLFNLGLNIKV